MLYHAGSNVMRCAAMWWHAGHLLIHLSVHLPIYPSRQAGRQAGRRADK